MSIDMVEFNKWEEIEDDYILEDFFPKTLPYLFQLDCKQAGQGTNVKLPNNKYSSYRFFIRIRFNTVSYVRVDTDKVLETALPSPKLGINQKFRLTMFQYC